MAYLAKDKDGHFSLTENKPIRGENKWSRNKGKTMVLMMHIDEELLNKQLTWDDEPIEITLKKNMNLINYVAVDKDGTELGFYDYPIRYCNTTWASEMGGLTLPKGTIEKRIGRKLTWENDPIKIEEK